MKTSTTRVYTSLLLIHICFIAAGSPFVHLTNYDARGCCLLIECRRLSFLRLRLVPRLTRPLDELLWRPEHTRSARGRLWRAHDIRSVRGMGRGGVKRARRLWVRDKIVRSLVAWRGKQQSFLVAAAPYFFRSMPACHTSRYGITENLNCRAQISRKYTDCGGGPGAHVGTAGARPQRPRARVENPWYPRRLENGPWGCETRSATLVTSDLGGLGPPHANNYAKKH